MPFAGRAMLLNPGVDTLQDTTNIRAYYDIREHDGSSNITDLSGNGYTLIGDAAGTSTTTSPGYITFDGTNDRYYTTLNYQGTNSISEMSVFAWIRTTFSAGVAGTWDNLAWSIWDFDRSEYFSFSLNGPGELSWSGQAGNLGGIGIAPYFDIVGSGGTYNDGDWHCIGITYSVANQEIVMYADGQVDTTFTANGSMSGLGSTTRRYAAFGDGSEIDNTTTRAYNDLYYEGDISQLWYWDNRTLTSAEVLKNYNDTKSRYN